MHEDSVLYVSRMIAHLASILLMLLQLPIFLADPQELVLLPGKIEGTDPCVFEKIAHLLLVRAVELEFAHYNCAPHSFLPSTDKLLPRNRFILMSGSEKLSLLMMQSTSSRFALIVQSFSCSWRYQLNSFLRSKSCW